jgi:endonuclease-3
MPKLKPVKRASEQASVKAAVPGREPVKRAAPPKGRILAATVHEIFSRFEKANPEPLGELEHVNHFTLLVAVVLSAQATDVGVNKATRALFKIADTPAKMGALGEEKLRDYIKTIGLFRTKAKNVIALSNQLIRDYGGDIPRKREELETLPGVGRKTANVVLNIAFGEPTIAVDTHLFRGGARSGENHPDRVHAPRSSLANPAWALRMQGASTRMREVRHLRSMSIG